MGDEVLERYAEQLQHVFDHYAEDEVAFVFVSVHMRCPICGMQICPPDSRALRVRGPSCALLGVSRWRDDAAFTTHACIYAVFTQ